MTHPKVLIVEDEPNIREIVRAYLEKAGYQVNLADNGLRALELTVQWRPDLMVLDLMLPDLSGEEVCREVRRTSGFPILMLTAKTTEGDKVHGLTIGADDYMTKPFSPRELTARVMSLLRRSGGFRTEKEQVMSYGGGRLMIDPLKQEVTLQGECISLTPLESKLLMTLAANPGRVYSRQDLVELIHGLDFDGFDRTVDVHIKNLRQKLGDSPRTPNFIGTVFGSGYKFLVEQDG